MDKRSEHGNVHESSSDQVEITVEDIVGDDQENKYEVNMEFFKALPTEMQSCETQNNLVEIKAESQDEYISTDGETFILKTDIKEECRDFNAFQDENSNWTERAPHEVNIVLKSEEYNDSSNNSGDFTENYIKTEDSIGNYFNEEDLALFNQQQEYAIIKEENEFQDHYIDSEVSNIIHETIKSEDDISSYECNLCDYKSYSKTNFKHHSALHDDPSKFLWYYCTKCNYKTRQKGHLRRHYLTHQQLDEVRVFTCAICDYKFKQKSTLRRHIYNVHTDHKNKSESNPTYNQPFKCDHCSYSTTKRSLLLSHLDKHKDARDVTRLFICDICSFSTKYRRNLRMHLETHKDSPELQIYECKVCKFRTRMGYCLKRHFLSKKHLRVVGKLEEYCPRSIKLKRENDG